MRSSATRCVAYLQNHDQVANSLSGLRLHQIGSPDLSRALTAVLLLGPQTPMLFMGQEFHADSPFLYFADHQFPLRELVRKGRGEFLSQFPGAAADDGRAALDDPAEEATFRRCQLDWRQCTAQSPALRLHRDLLKLRREDPVIFSQGRGGFEGAVLGQSAFLLRWFDDTRGDRLLVVNLGAEISETPLPEPLLAPPLRRTWALQWSSEQVCYAGSGAVDPHPEQGWLLPGRCAMLLAAVPRTEPQS
jgi:maltooligosyltrehalose trehalohydrolase